MRALAALAVCATLAGCASGPALTPDGRKPTAADAGAAPTALTQDTLRQVLRMRGYKDPDSAKVERIEGPSFISEPARQGQRPFYGWAVCFDVNAKNGFGAYTGYQKTLLVVRGETLVHFEEADHRNWAYRAEFLEDLCLRVAGQGNAEACGPAIPGTISCSKKRQ